MRIQTWGASDVGQVRRTNEDSFILAPDLGLFVVADGMGGFQRGDVASQLACNALRQGMAEHRAALDLFARAPSSATREAVKQALETVVQAANTEVYEAAVAITGEGGRMGTTLDVLLIVGSAAFVAHVGDGRVLLLRGPEVHQLTEDHSLVQQELSAGKLSEEQARTVRYKNVITRALGVLPSVELDLFHFDLDVGDRLLLCSDGLYRYLGLEELGKAMASDVGTSVVARLIEVGNQRGGRDNLTGVFCAVSADEAGKPVAPTRARLDALRQASLFQVCTFRELQTIFEACELREVADGDVVFHQGEVGREAVLLVKGQVALRQGDREVSGVSPGTLLGELVFAGVPKRSTDAVALGSAELLVLSRDAYRQLVSSDAHLGVKLQARLLLRLTAHLLRARKGARPPLALEPE